MCNINEFNMHIYPQASITVKTVNIPIIPSVSLCSCVVLLKDKKILFFNPFPTPNFQAYTNLLYVSVA